MNLAKNKVVAEDCKKSCTYIDSFSDLKDQTILITGGTGFTISAGGADGIAFEITEGTGGADGITFEIIGGTGGAEETGCSSGADGVTVSAGVWGVPCVSILFKKGLHLSPHVTRLKSSLIGIPSSSTII